MKKIIKCNYRVEVYPKTSIFGITLDKDNLDAVKDIEDQIKRHVDGIGETYINHDTEEICSFCGASWTEDGDRYNGCCDEDETEKP